MRRSEMYKKLIKNVFNGMKEEAKQTECKFCNNGILNESQCPYCAGFGWAWITKTGLNLPSYQKANEAILIQ